LKGPKVFISYSSRDQVVGMKILEYLEFNDVACWMAPRDILPGDNYAESIINGIGQASAFLLILSQHSNDSVQVQREVDRAVNAKIPIYPLKISQVNLSQSMEYYLCNTQWIDCSAGDFDQALVEVVKTLKSLKKKKGASSLAGSGNTSINKSMHDFLRLFILICLIAMAYPLFLGGSYLVNRGILDSGRPMTKILKEVDLLSLSDKELIYLNSEILARRGYIFEEPELARHFEKKFWYKKGEVEKSIDATNASIVGLALTAPERQNIDMIDGMLKERKLNNLLSGNEKATFPDQTILLGLCATDDQGSKFQENTGSAHREIIKSLMEDELLLNHNMRFLEVDLHNCEIAQAQKTYDTLKREEKITLFVMIKVILDNNNETPRIELGRNHLKDLEADREYVENVYPIIELRNQLRRHLSKDKNEIGQIEKVQLQEDIIPYIQINLHVSQEQKLFPLQADVTKDLAQVLSSWIYSTLQALEGDAAAGGAAAGPALEEGDQNWGEDQGP